MADFIVTIDGPAASGKSTVAQLLAEKIGASFLDTGAMYRAVTLAAMEGGIDLNDEEGILGIIEKSEFEFKAPEGQMAVSVNGVDVTERIREPGITVNVKYIASVEKLRERLVEMQRDFAAGEERIVTEGRDQGTVAFSEANIKFFLIADAGERARRRKAQFDSGENLSDIQKDIEARDRSDEGRSVGPLKPAEDAIVVDTTDMGIAEVVEKLFGYVRENA